MFTCPHPFRRRNSPTVRCTGTRLQCRVGTRRPKGGSMLGYGYWVPRQRGGSRRSGSKEEGAGRAAATGFRGPPAGGGLVGPAARPGQHGGGGGGMRRLRSGGLLVGGRRGALPGGARGAWVPAIAPPAAPCAACSGRSHSAAACPTGRGALPLRGAFRMSPRAHSGLCPHPRLGRPYWPGHGGGRRGAGPSVHAARGPRPHHE